MVALSLALHGAAWAAVARAPRAPARERIELEVVRHERPARRRLRHPRPGRAPASPSRPRCAARPGARPGAAAGARLGAPQPPAPGAPRPLPRVGLSLGSTVSTGGFAVGVGNTVYGRAAETAADPASVRPYAGGVVPAARLTAQPRILELPRIPYPADARRAGIEGQVVLVLRVDAGGAVRGVRVVDAPSPELARAADEGARRFRFAPALLEGEPVETDIRFTYTFLLE